MTIFIEGGEGHCMINIKSYMYTTHAIQITLLYGDTSVKSLSVKLEELFFNIPVLTYTLGLVLQIYI